MQRTRNRERTRANIVTAARAEFAAHGYAGARIKQIARGAGVNKELIYHYFRGKEHLFEEVRSEQLADAEADQALTRSALVDGAQDPSSLFSWRFNRMLGDLEWIKLLTWEAVQTDVSPPPNEEGRRATIQKSVKALKAAQKAGSLPADLDPRFLQLAIFALATYPLAFSQITAMTTGMPASDKHFHKAWTAFLQQLGHRLLALPADKPQVKRRAASQMVARRPLSVRAKP